MRVSGVRQSRAHGVSVRSGSVPGVRVSCVNLSAVFVRSATSVFFHDVTRHDAT